MTKTVMLTPKVLQTLIFQPNFDRLVHPAAFQQKTITDHFTLCDDRAICKKRHLLFKLFHRTSLDPRKVALFFKCSRRRLPYYFLKTLPSLIFFSLVFCNSIFL